MRTHRVATGAAADVNAVVPARGDAALGSSIVPALPRSRFNDVTCYAIFLPYIMLIFGMGGLDEIEELYI